MIFSFFRYVIHINALKAIIPTAGKNFQSIDVDNHSCFYKKRLFTKFYFLHIAHIKMTFLLFYQSVELLSAGQWTSLQATNETLVW